MTRDEMIKIVARTMGDRNPDAYFYTASAVLTAIEAAGGWAPEGYAVVPVEPSEDMLIAGDAEIDASPDLDLIEKIYRSMVAEATDATQDPAP